MIVLDRYSESLGTQNKRRDEFNFLGSTDCDKENNGLQMHVESCKVKEVTSKLMINGSSPRSVEVAHDGFKMDSPR